jgi:hypothetical protein
MTTRKRGAPRRGNSTGTSCGVKSNHQNSDRFVWRRCIDASCDAHDGTAKIQPACGVFLRRRDQKPYPDNPDLLEVFHTAEVPYEYALRMDDSGACTLTRLADRTGALLETIVVVNHKTRCVDNYYEGSLQGFDFGGQCTAPEQVSVTTTRERGRWCRTYEWYCIVLSCSVHTVSQSVSQSVSQPVSR